MKIPRNSVCPCGRNLIYKKCCGKYNPITGNMMSFISPDKVDASEFERDIKDYTGHYPIDYIKPIESRVPIYYILIDESKINNYYAVSGIVVSKDEIDKKISIKSKLNDLAEEYYVDSFHFTEIFGRRRIFRDKTNQFIDTFSEIVCQIEMFPFSVCMNIDEVKKFQNQNQITDEQVFISLQWQLMFKILKFMIWKYGIEFIIHMWREQENVTVEKRLLHQQNISGLLDTFPFAQISIYRHYEIFMKSEILYSSLSDLVAYFTTRVASRKESAIPEGKIIGNNYEIIKLISCVFKEYQFIDVKNLTSYICEVSRRENYRNKLDK
jgi:hypothetical protein